MRDIADETGLSRSYISMLASGQRSPSRDQARAIAKALNVRAGDIWPTIFTKEDIVGNVPEGIEADLEKKLFFLMRAVRDQGSEISALHGGTLGDRIREIVQLIEQMATAIAASMITDREDESEHMIEVSVPTESDIRRIVRDELMGVPDLTVAVVPSERDIREIVKEELIKKLYGGPPGLHPEDDETRQETRYIVNPSIPNQETYIVELVKVYKDEIRVLATSPEEAIAKTHRPNKWAKGDVKKISSRWTHTLSETARKADIDEK